MSEQNFLSFNKQKDWLKGKGFNLSVEDQGLFIHQLNKYNVSEIIRFDFLNEPSLIRDLCIGSDNKLFVLEDQLHIWMYDWMNDYHEILFHSHYNACTPFTTIASSNHYLFLADFIGNHKISAYSINNGQVLWHIDQWEEMTIFPLAIAHDQDQYVYVTFPLINYFSEIDKETIIPKDTELAVMKINHSGQIVQIIQNKMLFVTEDNSILDLKDKLKLSVLNDGSIYIFLTNQKILFHFLKDGQMDVIDSGLTDFQTSNLVADSNHSLYIGESREFEGAEEDRFILRFLSTGEFHSKLSGYRGRVDQLIIDKHDKIYAWNKETAEMTLLELSPRTMEMPLTRRLEGIYLSAACDSTSTETQWDKLMLDADIPEETQLKISYFASDRKEFFIDQKYVDLDDYIKDDQVDMQDKMMTLEPLWSEPIVNAEDALFFKGIGRYLWLKIEFLGSELKTPHLKKLRIYYDRSSYLSYLPGVYQQEPSSKDFLERFLALFQTFYEEIEEEVANVSQHFDADVLTGDFLKWLSTWLAISSNDQWTEQQLKHLIKLAPELYKKRGTKQAIEQMIHIYTGTKPLIIEFFQYKAMRKDVELKELMDTLYGSNPYSFTVLVNHENITSEQERRMVEKIIEDEKPAFTEAKMVMLEPAIHLDMHSYLEINSHLSEPTLMVLDQKSTMPHNTVLIDVDKDHQLDTHTRLGLDSELE